MHLAYGRVRSKHGQISTEKVVLEELVKVEILESLLPDVQNQFGSCPEDSYMQLSLVPLMYRARVIVVVMEQDDTSERGLESRMGGLDGFRWLWK